MSLSVVYVVDTGHVVGALAVTGGTASADVASLVGKELPLRISLEAEEIATLPLRDRQLAAAIVDDEPGVFAEPFAFGVELTPDGKPKPALRRLAPWPSEQGLELKAGTLKITVPVPVTDDTPVLVLISRDQDAGMLLGTIAAEKSDVTFQVDLTTGDTHGVLVLVAGQTGRFEAVLVG